MCSVHKRTPTRFLALVDCCDETLMSTVSLLTRHVHPSAGTKADIIGDVAGLQLRTAAMTGMKYLSPHSPITNRSSRPAQDHRTLAQQVRPPKEGENAQQLPTLTIRLRLSISVERADVDGSASSNDSSKGTT